MATQTLTFVLLPNGTAPQKKLRLSVFVTPRLAAGATLADFPEILHWPERVSNHGLTFEVSCAGSTETVTAPIGGLRQDIWNAIFKPSTFVDEYTVPDFADRLFVSYPVRSALSYLKYAYQSIGTAAGPLARRQLELVLGDLVFRDGPKSTLHETLAQQRVALWREQQAGPDLVALPRAETGLRMPSAPPDGVPSTLTLPAGTRDTMTRFALFHHMPPAPNRPPLPNDEAGFARTLDFHRALTALGSYPTLLRALGLVFDVEIPESLCPASPQGNTYASIDLENVTPGFTWSVPTTIVLPATSYVRSTGAFAAAPASTPDLLAAGTYPPGDVVDGVLALAPAWFHLVQVDLDGALLKALTLADNLANARDASVVGDALPALRSSGIALMANGRALQMLEAVRANTGFDDALASGSPMPRSFTARDITRGFRLDVWSSRTGKWHSLHRRDATYHVGGLQLHVEDEEGFVQPAVAQAAEDPKRKPDQVAIANGIPQPATDLRIHERVAAWAGWSLSVKRPGGALNRSPDPAQATAPDATVDQPMTPFKMTSSFDVRAGSLPELRFGSRYRMRARAVDLAGNSIPLTSGTRAPLVAPADGAEFPYLRFEPVAPPLVVLRATPGAGGSLARLVIRSHNAPESLDAVPTTETDERHIAPPQTSVRMAEQHGMFDNASGHLLGDQATYDLIVSRDRGAIPTDGDVPLEPSDYLDVPYLPDPIARGGTFRDLPNTPDDTEGRIVEHSLVYARLPDVQPRPGSVTFVDFGPDWPGRLAFRVALVEGAATPKWDATQRLLTVALPKAAEVEVELSSYLSDGDLELMGVWGWLRELFETAEETAMDGTAADTSVTMTSDVIALLTRLVREGGHEMITPSRTISLVHAVQQPMGRPAFTQLPVVHRPADPILASGLRNSFTPITAWRFRDSHEAVLLGGLQIHGGSTTRIDLEARWREVIDDSSVAKPTTEIHRDHVEAITLSTLDAGVLYSDASEARAVATYIPKVDALWFSAPSDELEGVETPTEISAPQHHFADTKHRWIAYHAVATSRFQEYFDDPSLDFTRSGPALMVDVPSSSRPAPPQLAYVVPTFGWERQETTNVKSSVRFGNGLRVYLSRPWYSSGADELLGVVLWPATEADPDYATREQDKQYFTQWGSDPIWASGGLAAVPGTWAFPRAKATAQGLELAGTTLRVDVAGHEVAFDSERRLWYCDIELSNSVAYTPFVRLALARYQPHSIDGVELSSVVLADYAQLAPSRSAVLTIDPGDPRRARLYVGGVGPQGPTRSAIVVTVEERLAQVGGDLGWAPAPPGEVSVTEDTPPPDEPTAVLWAGSIKFAHDPPVGRFRVVIREYERIEVEAPGEDLLLGQRLVYAAVIAFDYPPREGGPA